MNLSQYKEEYTLSFKFKRLSWFVLNNTIFRLLISTLFRKTRISILRLYGAKIPSNAHVYHTCKLSAP